MIETDAKEAIAESTLPSSKPPFLRRVQIRGYKSIAFCDVTLEPLTLLVGRNGSGKSNFLDALGFLKDIFETNLFEAVRSRDGWKSIHARDCSLEEITIEINADYNSPGNVYVSQKTAHYSITIKQGPFGVPYIAKETYLSPGNQGQTDVRFSRIGNFDQQRHAIKYDWDIENFNLSNIHVPTRQDFVWLATTGVPPFVNIADSIRFSGYYNFSPAEMRKIQSITSASLLERNGSNLAGMIRELERISPETISRVNRYLNAIVPDIEFCKAQTYGNYETVRFQMRQIVQKSGLQFDSFSMSDGTLRVLAALVAASQFELSPATGFVAIEEPETSLHPAAMHALVDALDEATLHTQILLTTHSAEMLDNPTIQPTNVRVVQMIDGQTVIAPVDEASVEIVKKKLNTLGGLERENQLEPDYADLERQRKLSLNGRSTTE